MKTKKVSNGYWIALGFVGISLIGNLGAYLTGTLNPIKTFEEWSLERTEDIWLTITDVEIDAVEAISLQSVTLTQEVESNTFFIPMRSSTSSDITEKTSLVLRVMDGEIYDFLSNNLDQSEAELYKQLRTNPDAFKFKGPFVGSIQKTNAAMRKIKGNIDYLDSDFLVFSPAESSPVVLALKFLVFVFVILLAVIIFKLLRKADS